MLDFAMLLKSYSLDAAFAQRLIASFVEHNVEAIQLFVVVPEEDVELFTAMGAANVQVIDETVLHPYFTDAPMHDIRPGYINQEIVKLAFWELGLAHNYFCVDSDAVFIRDFRISDFMFDHETPYTVLVEDNELKVEPRYYEQYWEQREAHLRRIQHLVGLDSPTILTCHGHQVLSAKVLESFVADFLGPRGWTYRDALAEAPYEFSWYNMWLQKALTIPIHRREPLVKVFHHEGHHLEYILRGISTTDIARGYVALVINSNYSRDLGVLNPHASKPESLSRYLSYREAVAVLTHKMKRTIRRS